MIEEVRSWIEDASGVHDDLSYVVKKRELREYDHVGMANEPNFTGDNERSRKERKTEKMLG